MRWPAATKSSQDVHRYSRASTYMNVRSSREADSVTSGARAATGARRKVIVGGTRRWPLGRLRMPPSWLFTAPAPTAAQRGHGLGGQQVADAASHAPVPNLHSARAAGTRKGGDGRIHVPEWTGSFAVNTRNRTHGAMAIPPSAESRRAAQSLLMEWRYVCSAVADSTASYAAQTHATAAYYAAPATERPPA